MKNIAILGSTGSIGVNTLNVARHLKDKLTVKAIAAHSNIDLVEAQAKEFKPELIAIFDEKKATDLKKRLPDFEVLSGMEGVIAAATLSSVDMVVSSMTGTRGLEPTVAAIQAGKDIGLANKESLVSGGKLVLSLVKEHGVNLLPIDSEHSAIFQCLNGEDKKEIHKIILTASGGPFRKWSKDELATATVDHALNHPTWTMGPKVTIDSSTLMNKGLEVIEAYWLFDVPVDQIDVVIHPQSFVHSMVEFRDGSIMAQMGAPTMVTPIQYALTYPQREHSFVSKFDFTKIYDFQFLPPDLNKFKCLKLAFDAIKTGKSLPCYMNAANEILVSRFLKREISWMQIADKLEDLMHSHELQNVDSLENILLIDKLARQDAAHI